MISFIILIAVPYLTQKSWGGGGGGKGGINWSDQILPEINAGDLSFVGGGGGGGGGGSGAPSVRHLFLVFCFPLFFLLKYLNMT